MVFFPLMVLPSLCIGPSTVGINLLPAELLSFRVWLKKDRWSTIVNHLTLQIRQPVWRVYYAKYFRNGSNSSCTQSNGTWTWKLPSAASTSLHARGLAPCPSILVACFATARMRDEELSGFIVFGHQLQVYIVYCKSKLQSILSRET